MKTIEQTKEYYLFNSCVEKTCKLMKVKREELFDKKRSASSRLAKSVFYYICSSNLLKYRDIKKMLDYYGCEVSTSTISRYVSSYDEVTRSFPQYIKDSIEDTIAF